MSQLVSDAMLAMLDRKYEFVVNSPRDPFMLDLHLFLDFLRNDELIRDFADKLKELQLPVVVLPITVSFLFEQGNDFNAQVIKYVGDTIAENQINYGEETI